MKRLLCVFCAALMLCACIARNNPAPQGQGMNPTEAPAAEPTQLVYLSIPEIQNYAGFSDALAAKLLDGTENKNLSPISVYLALALTAEGAKGETQTALLGLLGCDSLETLRGVCGAMLSTLPVDSEDAALEFADSIWMADRNGALTFRADYLKVLADVYRSEANTVRFETADAAQQIADWIREHTRGKIKISKDALHFDLTTVAVLINTIYLKAGWIDAFYEGATEPGTFIGVDGEQTVSYMNREDDNAVIVKGDGFLRYSLNLCRIGRMTFVLPDEGIPLSDLLGSSEKLHVLLRAGEELRADVSVKLPKFKYRDKLELDEALQSLGVGIMYSFDADFTGMCDDPAAAVSRVLQESFIGIDEKGVEAAAYTMVAMNDSCALSPEDLPKIDFHLTRPFLYVIESYDGTVLFIGTVTNPTPAE